MTFKIMLIVTILTVTLIPSQPAYAEDIAPIQRLGTGIPTSIAAAPDGSAVAVGSSIGVWLLDPASLQPVGFLETHAWVNSVRYSVDGRYLQANARVYDLAAQAWTDLDGAGITWTEHRCTREGRYCLVDSTWPNDGTVVGRWVRDTTTGIDVQLVSRFATQMAWAADDNRFYAVLHDASLASWEFQPGLRVWPPLVELKGFFTTDMRALAWSADGAGLAAGGRRWDVASGRAIGEHACILRRRGLLRYDCTWPTAFLPLDSRLYLYDDPLGYQSRSYFPHRIKTKAFSESADGQWVATSGTDDFTYQTVTTTQGSSRTVTSAVATTRLWQRATLQEAARLPIAFDGLALSPGGEVAFGFTQSGVEAWSWQTRQQLWHIPASTYANCELTYYRYYSHCANTAGTLAVSPDGHWLAFNSQSTGTGVVLARSDTGEQATALTGHTGMIWSLAFSPDGRHLAAGSNDGTVLIWNVPAGQP